MKIDINQVEKELETKENKTKYLLELLEELKISYTQEVERSIEIAKLEQYLKTTKKPIETYEESIQKKDSLKKLDIDISKYKKASTLSALVSILPDKNTREYNEIINLLILHYTKELTELMNLISSEYKDGMIDEFKEEIEALNIKIATLHSLKENKKTEEKQDKNIIICMPKLSGENIILYDIENIIDKNPPKETLKTFKELLESIINGTFKGIKRFTNNQKLNGLAEVKQDNARIVFKHLENNIYIIIYMFIKDCRKDKLYQETLQKRAELFSIQKEELKNLREDESYKILELFKEVK